MDFTTIDFKRPVGIELTFVPKEPDRWHHDPFNFPPYTYHDYAPCPSNRSWDQLTKAYKRFARDTSAAGWKNIHADYGCVEYPSPILRSWEKAKDWYEHAMVIGDLIDVVPYEESQEGGCGHIHMGNVSDKVRHSLMVETWTRPWLSWVFASPNVTEYCRSIDSLINQEFVDFHQRTLWRSNGDMDKTLRTAHNAKRFYVELDEDPTYLINSTNKSHILRHTHETVEWRAFDAAATWNDQASMIAFYQKFVAFSENRASTFTRESFPAPLYPGDIRQAFRSNMNSCIRDFKRLIAELELPLNEYKDLLRINLRPAFEFGRRL